MNVEPEEIEQLLVKTARLTEENTKILRRMQRANQRAVFMQFLHWIVIIGSFAALYYLIQPYIVEIKALTDSYKNVLDSRSNSSVSNDEMKKFLDTFGTPEDKDKASENKDEGTTDTKQVEGVPKVTE